MEMARQVWFDYFWLIILWNINNVHTHLSEVFYTATYMHTVKAWNFIKAGFVIVILYPKFCDMQLVDSVK